MQSGYFFNVNPRLKLLIAKCIELMNGLKVPISNSIYFKECKGASRFGYCKRNTYSKGTEKHYEYTVAINRFICDDRDIESTVVHELLHTIEGAQNHQRVWKKWAAHVVSHTDYVIERVGNATLDSKAYDNKKVLIDASLYNPATMHIAECPVCHMRIYIRKQRGVVPKGATKYICKKCKQRLMYVSK